MKSPPAIIVSCAAPGLAVMRSLARAGISTVAATYVDGDAGNVSRSAHRRVSVPHAEKEESAFVEALRALAGELTTPVIFGTSDAALGSLSRNLDRLGDTAIVACPSRDAVATMLDKTRTADLAQRCGVPFPRWSHATTPEATRRFTEEVAFPLLVKPAVSHRFVDRFHFKMTRVNDWTELDAALDHFRDAGVVLQEVIPGTDRDVFNYNAYVIDGEARVEFTARQLRKAPPITGSPCVVISQKVPEVIEPGRALVRGLNLTGFVCIEFARDSRDGRLVVIDINGRHNLSAALAPRCGIDFPLIDYHYRVRGDVPKAQDFLEGIYWVDLLRDIRSALHPDHPPSGGLRGLGRPYWSRHASALWSLRDPAPFAKRAFGAVRRLRE